MDIERVAPAPVLIVPAFRSINQQWILRAKYGSGMKQFKSYNPSYFIKRLFALFSFRSSSNANNLKINPGVRGAAYPTESNRLSGKGKITVIKISSSETMKTESKISISK